MSPYLESTQPVENVSVILSVQDPFSYVDRVLPHVLKHAGKAEAKAHLVLALSALSLGPSSNVCRRSSMVVLIIGELRVLQEVPSARNLLTSALLLIKILRDKG